MVRPQDTEKQATARGSIPVAKVADSDSTESMVQVVDNLRTVVGIMAQLSYLSLALLLLLSSLIVMSSDGL